MLRTPIGNRILAGHEGRLFAESLLSMLDLEICQGETNPDWNHVFRRLTHDQQVWMLNVVMRAALLKSVRIPTFTAEGEAALAAVYEHMYNNIVIELDLEREAVEQGEVIEDRAFWRKAVVAAAKEKHLSEIFEGFVEPEAITPAIRENNEDDRYDPIPIWPTDTCDDPEQWETILGLLEETVFFDRDWLLDNTFLDLPHNAASKLERRMTIPAGYFGNVHPDPLPAETRKTFVKTILFLRKYLGYDVVPPDEIQYYGPPR